MDSVVRRSSRLATILRALFLVPFFTSSATGGEQQRELSERGRGRRREAAEGRTTTTAIVTHYLAVTAFSLFRLSNKGRRTTQRHAAAALSKAVRRKIEDRQKRDVPPSLPPSLSDSRPIQSLLTRARWISLVWQCWGLCTDVAKPLLSRKRAKQNPNNAKNGRFPSKGICCPMERVIEARRPNKERKKSHLANPRPTERP